MSAICTVRIAFSPIKECGDRLGQGLIVFIQELELHSPSAPIRRCTSSGAQSAGARMKRSLVHFQEIPMQAINRSLLALALGAICAAPAFAGDKPPSTSKKPTASSTATDATSARTTMREAGKTKPPTSTDTSVSSQATNPGQGNWWAAADIDGDGKLSATEAKAQAGLDARFSTVDADADGYVTNEEYRKFFTSDKSQGEAHAAAHSAVVTRDMWAKFDANHDGKLSASEVNFDTTVSGAFSTMDSNGDGFVTDAEYRNYAKANMHK
jgi:hypothetical protein